MEKEKEKEKLIQERNELNLLIGNGVKFDVKDVTFDVHRNWYGRKIYTPVKQTRHIEIYEPTLSVLDRMSAEWVEISIDEQALKESNDALQIARTLVANHAERCARIIAIAALGEDIWIAYPVGGTTRYQEDTGKLEDLTTLFLHTIKPSQLAKIFIQVNLICNLGDFMDAIRLMLAGRTTMPIRMAEQKV